jgi:branched-chain amino acid transport system substrate-binding protein
MLRIFSILALLFIISSCVSSTQTLKKDVIPRQKITGEPLAPSVIEEGRYNIALIVPLKDQIGSFLVKASQLAITQARESNINLILLNSNLIEQDPHLLQKKLNDNNVKAIVGPVYTKETVKLLELTKEQNIPILSLSNDSSIKEDSLLIMGLSPDAQAKALTSYSISQGINHFYLVLPSNKYGKLIEEAVAEEVSTKSNVAFNVTWYNIENSSYTIDALVQSIATKGDHNNEAIFMPQGGISINHLNTALEKHKLKIPLIGSQAWDNPNILNFPLFNGAILLQKKDLSEQNFSNEYNNLFHAQPNNIDLICYNSLNLLLKMIKNNQAIDKQSIIENNPNLFNTQGISLHKMPIVEVHNKQFRIVE